MANLGHYDTHPGYTNQAIIIGKKIKTTQAGNVSTWEVEASRGAPWFGGAELDPDDRGVNGAGILFDMLTDDVTWLGAPESFLHQASFQALHDAIDDFRISPLITDQQEGQAVIARLFEYFDLWARPHPDTWQFQPGIWQHGDIDVDVLPEIGSDDLTEEPDLTGNGYADTINYVRVRFSDREHSFKEKLSDPAADANNFRIVGEKRAIELDRTWCTDLALANRAAAEYLKMNAQPLIPGTIKVKRERVSALGLYPGNLAKLNVASDGRTYVIRITEMEWPAESKGDCTLTIENERGIWPQLYVPPPAPQPGNFVVEPVEIVNERFVELPSQLRTTSSMQIAVLAQRPSDKITGFAVHVGIDPDVLDLVAPHNNFAAYGKLVDADYSAAGPTLDTATGIIVEIFGVDKIDSQTDTQRDDDNILIFFGNEIGSAGTATPIGGGKFQVTLRRARYGSLQSNHLIGEDVWFVHRDRLTPISNKNFVPGATCYFKLQPYTQTQEYDLALVDAIAHVIGDGPFILSGLELAGQGNDPVFTGRDPKFAWRMFSTAGAEITGPELSLGAWDDQFAQFNLRVRDVDSSAVVWTGSSKVPEYIFDFEQNARCAGGPRNKFHFEVAALATDGRETPWMNFGEPFENTVPAGSGGSVTARYDRFDVALNPVADLDYAGIIVLRHKTDPDFGVNDTGVEIAFVGPGPNFIIPQPEATTWYYRSAPFDAFTDPALWPGWPGTSADLYALLDFGDLGAPAVPFTTLTLTPTLSPPPISVGSQSFDTPFDVSVDPPAGMKVVYAFDRATLRDSAEWPGGIGSYGVINIAQSCTLHWRGIDADGVLTQEGIAVFTLVASGGAGLPTCAGVSVHITSGVRGRTAVTVTLSCAQSGSTVHVNKNGAGWVAYTTPIVIALDTDSIEFYASASGYSDSPIDAFDNPSVGDL